MIFSWFDAREAEEFGSGLAGFFDEKMREIEKSADRKHEEKRTKLVTQVMQQAQEFGKSHRLNLYKKAKLGNAFKWKLKDLGHDQTLIDLMTKDLMIVLR